MRFAGWTMDLRRAMRTLARSPGFTLIAAGMLALAIGATASMFAVVDTVLLQRLPYAHPERLVAIAASAPGSDFPAEFDASGEFFLEYQENSQLLEDIATTGSFTSTLRSGDRVERVRMSWPTNSLYSTLGVTPILGRLPVAEDESNVALISHALWMSWFGGDPGVIGRTINASGADRTVVGVMGPEFRFPTDDTLLWISYTLLPSSIEAPGDFDWPMIGRLKPGVTPAALADELTRLARRAPERFGGSTAYRRIVDQHRAVVRPLGDQLLGDISRPLWLLLAACGVVLLIACANVANLFLVRTEGRHRELAVRRALGADRGALLRLQLAEAFVVAALAAVLAVALAATCLPALLRMAPPGIPRLDQVGLNATTVLFTALIAAVAGLVCGGLPALRGSAPDLARLRDGGRGMTGRRHVLRHALVAGQTALALVLLIGSGLLWRSAHELNQVDPGYDTQNVFTFQIAPERPELGDAHAFARFHLAFLERLAALPGVDSVGLVENVPLDESTARTRLRTDAPGADEEGTLVNVTFAAGDYFRTMGIDLLAGRVFTHDDHGAARGNLVVSESAAKRLWPGLDPVGRRLQRPGQAVWETVVGVVEDVMQDGFRAGPQAVVYFPLADTTTDGGRVVSSPAYVVKTARAAAIGPEIRALVREVAPEAPMYRTYTLAGLVERSLMQLSFTLLTLGITALLALILGTVGLYGVLSYIVAERTREIGVRMALGARATQVRALIVAQGARVVGAGIAAGLVAALAFSQVLAGLLYGVEAGDAATFASMAVAMAAVGLLASYVPARRASRLDPNEALRRD